jgi:hypothetical protein
MSFSQSAATNIVPLIARLVLAAVFIPAGYNKLMREAEFSGEEAKRLRELSVIASADADGPFHRPLIVPASLRQEAPSPQAEPNAGGSTPPSQPSTDEAAGGATAHARQKAAVVSPYPRRVVAGAIAVLLVLIFSKHFYTAGLSSFYTFYLIEKFGLSVQSAQIHLFVFLFASALGTLLGGPIGDRVGRKPVIWFSILGVSPFALLLPHADLFWTTTLTILIGLILSSAFSAILVYAQELMPGRVGTVSGLFFGFAFGMAGLGAAVLGMVADRTGIEFVYRGSAWLPLLGVVAVLLPKGRSPRH